jgi:hypothetical protein
MNMKLKPLLLATVLTLAVATQPPRVVAQEVADPTVDGFGSKKFWDYALCGASIALASGTGGWVFAVIVCGSVATEHWTK